MYNCYYFCVIYCRLCEESSSFLCQGTLAEVCHQGGSILPLARQRTDITEAVAYKRNLFVAH